jgi:hypothetical protein
VDNGVCLPIDLVVEVEREPPVARIGGERQHERDDRDRSQKEKLDGATERLRQGARPAEVAGWQQ